MGQAVDFYSRPDTLPINFYSRPESQFLNAVLYLQMEGTDGSTNFIDSSTYNHTMTALSTTQIDTSTFVSGSASGQFIVSDVHNNPTTGLTTPYATEFLLTSTNDFTFECYARFNEISGGSFYQDFYDNAFYLYRSINGSLLWYGTDAGGSNVQTIQSATGILTAATWYLIRFVKTGLGITIFLDNILVAQGTINILSFAYSTAVPVRIGTRFQGWLDDVAFYNYIKEPGGQPINFYSLP